MSSVTNAGSSSCLWAVIHPLIASICLCVSVFVYVCNMCEYDSAGAGQMERFF